MIINTPELNRRQMLKTLGAVSMVNTIAACTTPAQPLRSLQSFLGHVVIVGGGFGGATAAKYLHLWGQGRIAITLIERQAQFVSCPMSNLVLGGSRTLDELTFNYDGLRALGITVLQGEATHIDSTQQTITLRLSPVAGSNLVNVAQLQRTLQYDRLILSPGVDFLFNQIEGFDDVAQTTVLHAWKAGSQTTALQQQIVAMPDGGTVAISIPKAPYRCPPGPYERACQIAAYLKVHQPNSKVLILDANEDIQSKKALFLNAWSNLYPNIIDYRSRWEAKRVNAKTSTLESELGDTITANVLNVIPPMRAGQIAQLAGVVNINQAWCGVNWLTMESSVIKHIHVLGDAVQAAPGMPKSGHMANQHGKIAAAAIVELFHGRTPTPLMMVNTCYSYVDAKKAMHVASVHRFDVDKKTMLTVPNSGGVSSQSSELEGDYAWSWAQTIWQDMLQG